MLCKTFSILYHKTGFGIFFLAFFLVLFCSFFLNTHNSFAVSDVTYNITSSDTFPYYICYTSGQGTPVCSDYKYIIFNPVYSTTPTSAINTYFTVAGLYGARILTFTPTIIELKSPVTTINFPSFSPYLSSVEVTLTSNDISFGSISGSLSITENGTYDVTNYAEAVVDVPAEVIPGDYHDDLQDIKQGIYVCGAVLLVLYFFYCIYRMIIKGVK